MSKNQRGQADSSQDNAIDYVTYYAKSVVKGETIAGPHVRDACKRHLKDLLKAPKRGFFFDKERAEWAIQFCQEVLRLNGGDFEGEPFDPLPWQKFILGSIFGWVNKEGKRRFKKAFIETSKGSGKSPLASSVGLYGLTADGEARAEVYAAAAKKDQAMILFRDAVAMVDQSPDLNARLIKSGRGEQCWNLSYRDTGSFFRPISSDNAQSGTRPHMALLDEIHEHKSDNMVEQMLAGMKGRKQPMVFMITNSGFDRETVCWKYHQYGTEVASGYRIDDTFFAYICALDKDDDPFQDESCWIKTNPSLGVTIQLDYLRDQVTQARGMPSKESIVRRLNFSQWVGANNPWISSDVWFSAQEAYDEEFLHGRRCYGGLDLSSRIDLTALVLAFEPTPDDPLWRLKSYFWLPEEGLQKKGDIDGVDYLAWVRLGFLYATPGKAIDKAYVLFKMAEIASQFELQGIGYDRARIEDLRVMMDNEGIDLPMKDFGQGFLSMAPAVDDLEGLLIDGKIKHDGNPVLTWNAANVVMDTNPAGDRKPTKRKSTGKIDGMVAAIMAVGIGAKADTDYPVIGDDYEFLSV